LLFVVADQRSSSIYELWEEDADFALTRGRGG
jgi:hypothetical protein